MGESPSDPTGEELFQEARELFEQGEFGGALASFERAHARDPGNATWRSHYGLCVGIAGRNFERAAELCREAAKQEFFNPEQYLNLARLHLAFGFKSEGIRYLRRGRMIDPDHHGIARELSTLGRRGDPVLAFLPRRHVLNRWLGFARNLLGRGEAPLAA